MYRTGQYSTYLYPTPSDSRSDTSTETDQPELHSDQHHQIMLTQLVKTASSKAKSSLCRNFTQKGSCPYDKKCQFAHGPEQLRINMKSDRCFKTKGCHSFIKKGYCCYGQRCNFIHQSTTVQNTSQKWRTMYANYRELMKGGQSRDKSRLMEWLGCE